MDEATVKALLEQFQKHLDACKAQADDALAHHRAMTEHVIKHGLGRPLPQPSTDDQILAGFLADPANRAKVLALAKQTPAPG